MAKSRRMKWAGHVAWRRKRNACRFLWANPEVKKLLGRTRYRRADNIKMELGDMDL
jgi:hypothetical protein